MLCEIAPQTEGIAVSVGLPIMYGGGIFNCASMLVDGKISGFAAKQNLAGDGVHYEPRWFKPWPSGIQGEVEIAGQSYPVGDILFDVGDVRIGFEICEDAWVGNRPGASHAARGADMILNPSASHFAFGKHLVRREFVVGGSRAFNVTYIYANLVGNESGRVIFDGDAIIAAAGKLLVNGPRLSFRDVLLTTCVVDIDRTRTRRARTSSFDPEVDGDVTDILPCKFDYPEIEHRDPATNSDTWQASDQLKCEEFTRSVSLGLFDYMRKSRSRGFVISLSGGADSSSAAVLVSTALKLAEQDLGFQPLLERLSNLIQTPVENHAQLMRQLLTTVYQSTRNSGPVTRNAARNLASALGCLHLELDVEPMVQNYTTTIENAIGKKLNWDEHDITLQNIQARSRAPSVWMLANLKNALLLATSNRSEAAVGYATMDGDTCGGLSPLTGIDKAFLREWLRWMEQNGPIGLAPVPELECVNAQQPTAELRPSDAGQTDESDLMPYEILDQIERLAIRDKKMPFEVYQKILQDNPEIEARQLGNWTIKFFRLWSRNQWKRERYAPSFHLDDESLDPKTWCRFPILSGGFEYEIKFLQEKLSQLR